MQEQRIEAYLGLIQQLLACPREEEPQILTQSLELVDAGFVQVCELVAAQLQEAGGENQAEFLGDLAQRVGKYVQQEVRQQSQDESIPAEYRTFLEDALRLTSESNVNPPVVYPFLDSHRDKLHQDLIALIPTFATSSNIVALFSFARLLQQFPLGQRAVNLEIAIAIYRKALDFVDRQNYPIPWANLQHNLASAYSERIRGERAENLERAITAYEAALEIRTRSACPEQWAMTQNNLAAAYLHRIQRERAENLERAIGAREAALEVYTRSAYPEQWAKTQNNLGVAYSERIRGERAENLERAIAACEAALEVYTHSVYPEDWAMTQHNLASAYSERIRGKRENNLERAIAAYEAALSIYTRNAYPEQWAMTQHNLAAAYSERIQGERAKNLERAIDAYEAVLEVYARSAYPEQWAKTQNNLAITYSERIQGERAENLERAIGLCEAALSIYTRSAYPEQWAMTQHNLAITYSERVRGERENNLEWAISSYKAALEIRTRNAYPEQWAETQHNLAITYSERIQGERAKNLERSIGYCKAALSIYTRSAYPEQWARTQHNLAHVYSYRIQGEREDNLERAIGYYEEALDVYTRSAYPEQWAMTQNNLANAYLYRIQGARAKNLEWAISCYEEALDVYTCNAFPNDCRGISRNLANLQAEQQNWVAAANAYSQALDAAELLYQACLLLDSQAAELKETADLPRRAAYAYAKTGQLDRAVATIEQGRARGLSNSLQRDRADLQHLQDQCADLYEQYRDITNQLRNLENLQRDRRLSDERHALTPEAHRNQAAHLNQQLNQTLEQIRQVPGYETFLNPIDFSDLQRTLTPDNPLVYLIPTPLGSLALIVTPQNIQDLWLDEFTETDLQEVLMGWFGAYDSSHEDSQNWRSQIETITGQLWDGLMSPLITFLKQHDHSRATLIPNGYLSLLPLHAAWTTDDCKPSSKRYVLDEFSFSYAPNGRSLLAARTIAERHPQPDSILAIENPTEDIAYAQAAIDVAISGFKQSQRLIGKAATIEAISEAISQYPVLNFYGHGSANFQEPLNSGLAMNNGVFTLGELIKLNLIDRETGGIRLAVLSACETGLPGLELADEVIGLPNGLLQAGVAGVIASLWSVSDLSTSLLLRKFYQLWRDPQTAIDPQEALRQAQIWLRDSTNGEKKDEGMGLRRIERDARSFAHPYHWAGFSYVGI